MKKRIGQVFSLVLAVVLIIVMAIPAHADVSDAAGYVVGEFWDMMTGKEYDMYFNYWKNFAGYLAGEECPSSPDKYHHGNVPVGGIGVFGSGGTDDNGKFVWHTCDYCGEQFKVYASDLQQSYDAQVAELPATGYNSAGCLMWQPTVADIDYSRFESQTVSGGTGYEIVKKLPHTYSYGEAYYSISSNVNGTGLEYISSGGSNMFNLCTGIYFKVPVSGSYRYDKITCSYNILLVSGKRLSDIVIFEPDPVGFSHSETGRKLYFGYGPVDLASRKDVSYGTASVPFPIYEVIPDTAISGDAYTINSRPTSITSDYGIIGDNGQIIKVEGDKIVNETNNTYVNPATGTTDTITDWSYDYSTRTYTLTLGGGTTTTVTYGDENVVIKEGDITYNVYYLVNGSGSENPDPGTDPDTPPVCDHTWTETSRTDPTCTTAGKVTSTCSKCNQTKTETIPATGHSWVVDRTVQTTYDEEGNLLQQGYTIYSCSVCGEQYKDMEGTGPPADDNTGDGGIIEFLDGLVKSLSENLHGVVELILSFFREIPPMFDGFLAFLTAMFPFLPPELMTLLSFGIAAVVLIGVIKAIRR